MIVTLEIDPASRALVSRHAASAPQAEAAFAGALGAAVFDGAESVREDLALGRLGLRPSSGQGGLEESVSGWMIDRAIPLAAVGVPSNAPAARYAAMQEFGGRIVPRTAKALAVPISAEAKGHESPRDMEGLSLMPRRGKPPLLVRLIGGGRSRARARVEVHWVLVPSVTILGTGWLSSGVRRAVGAMERAFGGRLRAFVKSWKAG